MRRVPAPPAEVYAILADYTEGHPHILPSAYFRNIEVEEGGVGAGTRIRFEMTVLGTSRRVNQAQGLVSRDAGEVFENW